jgi:hypothetical protein
MSAQPSKDMQRGNRARRSHEQSGEKNSQKPGDGKGNQPDPNKRPE